MKSDPTIRDVLESLRKAPRRLLDVRVSTIGWSVWFVVRLLLLLAAYVAIVLGLGKILGYWWKVPSIYYVFAFLIGPMSYIRELWRERKQTPER